MNVSFLEMMGYAATVIVAISLMMRRIKQLRIYNMIGSFLFSLYGVLIQAWPVAILNGFIVLINIFELLKMSRRDIAFSTQTIHVQDSWYIKYYLNFFKDDIKRFFPEFELSDKAEYEGVLIMRDVLPAGVVILKKNEGPDAEIVLDYTHPEFRDYQNARYFFNKGCEALDLKEKKYFITPGMEAHHVKFLKKMNFVPHPEINGWYMRKIGA